MASKKDKITKKNWISDFTLVGKPVINDYTFKIDEKSNRSDWTYSSINLGVDCGEKHGVIYCECMGGYSPSKENVIYAHGKNEDGSDDFKTQILVDWSDRFNESILDELGDACFFNVGLEKTDKGKTYTKRFLTQYDAIEYIKEHLESDMVVNVRGQLKYSIYNDNVQVRKNIQSIYLSRVEEPSDFHANFRQSILLDADSASLKDVDKETGTLYVNARVLDYIRDFKGVEIRGQYPFNKVFEYHLDLSNKDLCKKIMDKLFKVKKDVTQMTWEGEFVEGGAIVTATEDDLPDDIKDLIGIVFTLEEALAKCASNGSRERKMVLTKPYMRMMGDDDNKSLVLQKFVEAYTEDVLDMSWVNDEIVDEDEDEVPFDESSSKSNDGDDMSWLDSI